MFKVKALCVHFFYKTFFQEFEPVVEFSLGIFAGIQSISSQNKHHQEKNTEIYGFHKHFLQEQSSKVNNNCEM
jgi:hypothetical protein